MVAWFSIAPDDGSGSYSRYVAKAMGILASSGLTVRLGAMGTEVEGPRDQVFAIIARCHEAMAMEPGVRRVATVIKIDDRLDATPGELERKVRSVEEKRSGGAQGQSLRARVGQEVGGC